MQFSTSSPDSDFPGLANHFLIAMPNMLDPNFSGTVIYVCEHNEKGALGLVVNRDTEILVSNLFDRIELKLEIAPMGERRVLYGGPVQSDRGFVLHTPTRNWNSTLQVGTDVSLTTSKDVLEALADGHGPSDWLITLGYAGWSAGQLESEIADNAWLTVPAKSNVLFQTPVERRFDEAFRLLGFDPGMLSSTAGHA
jgi:putative transcriptional regulator